MAKKAKVTGYKYTGINGAFIIGVHAGDLTVDQYKKFADIIEEQQTLTGLVLYEPVTDSPAENEEV